MNTAQSLFIRIYFNGISPTENVSFSCMGVHSHNQCNRAGDFMGKFPRSGLIVSYAGTQWALVISDCFEGLWMLHGHIVLYTGNASKGIFRSHWVYYISWECSLFACHASDPMKISSFCLLWRASNAQWPWNPCQSPVYCGHCRFFWNMMFKWRALHGQALHPIGINTYMGYTECISLPVTAVQLIRVSINLT